MAEIINLNAIIEANKLDIDVVAETLFPHNKCKKQAVYRVMRGDAELTESQISRLAQMCGCLAADLYSVKGGMPMKPGYEDGCITLSFGPYKAKVNYGGAFLTVFKEEKIIEQMVTTKVEHMTLPQLVECVKIIINKKERKE